MNWFYILYILSQSGIGSNSPSRLEPVFLLNSGASILVLNTPTYVKISQMFNVCIHDQRDTSKTLTPAN